MDKKTGTEHYTDEEQYGYSALNREPGKLRAHFDRGLTAFLVIAACLLFYFLLLRIPEIGKFIGRIFKILNPIWFGLVFAYILNPLMRWIERLMHRWVDKRSWKRKLKHGLCRGVAIFFSAAIFLSLIILLFNLLLPQLYNSMQRLVKFMPQQIKNLENWINNLAAEDTVSAYLKQILAASVTGIEEWIKTKALGNFSGMMTSVTVTLKSVVGGIIDVVMGMIVCVYMLISKERFIALARKLLYANVRRDRANFIAHLSRKSNEIFSGFLIGKIIDSIIVGIICFIGMSIFRISVNYNLLVSVIIGVTNIIPVFGPYIGAIPSVFLIFLESPIHALYFLILILVIRQVDGNLICPYILGDSTGLSAFAVIVAIIVGGGLFGFIGMLLGVPVFAVLRYIFDMILTDKLKRKGLPVETEGYKDMMALREDNSIVTTEEFEVANDAHKKDGDEKLSIIQKIRLLSKERKKRTHAMKKRAKTEKPEGYSEEKPEGETSETAGSAESVGGSDETNEGV